MKDARDKTIRIGDVILYGYGFFREPKVGIVTKVHTTSFSYRYASYYEPFQPIIRLPTPYELKDGRWRIIDSRCNRPDAAIVVNPLAKNPDFVTLFGLNQIELPYNTDFFEEDTSQDQSEVNFANIVQD